jgi:hypothetical protein
MAQDSFQRLVDIDRGGDVDQDPRPGKIFYGTPTSNKYNSPTQTSADFTGEPSNGYVMSTTTHLGESGQPVWVSMEATRIQNGAAQTLTMDIFNEDSRPQVVVNVADMSQGSPNIGLPGNGTHQGWQLNGEQLGYFMSV